MPATVRLDLSNPRNPTAMTVLVLVVAGNILLATLFSLVALASD
ncbi:hypothetical protein [Methylobacterium marchantiae]|uniref:Uncharacterized protein n=1 Tax=Methylobacterium marchantiae TaxID=600331 RepID=A0ABW3WV21_9HYPH